MECRCLAHEVHSADISGWLFCWWCFFVFFLTGSGSLPVCFLPSTSFQCCLKGVLLYLCLSLLCLALFKIPFWSVKQNPNDGV